MEGLYLVLGLVIGGITELVIMCCLQISKLSEERNENKKHKKTVLDKSNRS